MAGVGIEVVYVVLIFIGFIGVIAALFDTKWEVQDLETVNSPSKAQVYTVRSKLWG